MGNAKCLDAFLKNTNIRTVIHNDSIMFPFGALKILSS